MTDDPLDRDLASALDALDYPVRRVSADVIIQRARARTAQRRWRFAAAAVVMLAASMAAALPGSPVRRWVESTLRGGQAPQAPRAQAPSADVAERVLEMRGVVSVIADSAEVAFSELQEEGEVVIRLILQAELRVRASDSTAAFQVRPQGILVRNAGSRASYELEVSDRASDVRVLASGRPLFVRRGGQIVRGPNPRGDGAYVVSLRSADRR